MTRHAAAAGCTPSIRTRPSASSSPRARPASRRGGALRTPTSPRTSMPSTSSCTWRPTDGAAGDAAVLPLIRLYGVDAGCRSAPSPRGLPLQPARRARRSASWSRSIKATILMSTPTFLRSRTSSGSRSSSSSLLDMVVVGRRSCRRPGATSSDEVQAWIPSEGYGTHGAFSGGGGQHSRSPLVGSPARRGRSLDGRPASSGVAAKVIDPETRQPTWGSIARALAHQGAQCDEGLSAPAGEDGGGDP